MTLSFLYIHCISEKITTTFDLDKSLCHPFKLYNHVVLMTKGKLPIMTPHNEGQTFEERIHMYYKFIP